MPGSAVDPAAMTDAEKLNFLVSQMASLTDQQTSLVAQVTTINNRLETHGKRLAALEKAPAGPVADAAAAADLALYGDRASDTGPGGGLGGQGGRGGRGGDFYGHQQYDGGWGGAMIVPVKTRAATVAPSSIFHRSMGKLTRCHGSTSVKHISAVCAPWLKRRCGSPPCTSKAWRLTGIMPWSGIMLSPLGQGLQNL
jgi:hypothetical protein